MVGQRSHNASSLLNVSCKLPEFDVTVHSIVILVCNGKTCIFIRVVDTCAGCAKGSRHVDLTRAAFSELASLDEGVLTVQMRQATDPDNW